MKKRFIIYDCGKSNVEGPFTQNENTILFNALPTVSHCIGCFGCWIKTPGKCMIRDRCAAVPSYIAQSSEVIIISPLLYGGFSSNVKSVLDRSIGYLSPFFRMVNGKMHHKLKTDNPFQLTVHFFGPRDAEEEDIAGELVAANAVNLGAAGHRVVFHDTFSAAKEAVL